MTAASLSSQQRALQIRRANRSSLLFLFGIGLATAVRFNFVGEIFLSDFIFCAALPFAVFRQPHEMPWRYAAPLVFLAFLWLVGAIFSDIVRHSPFHNYARGWAKIVFTMIAFIGLLGLTKARPDRLMSYFAGIAVAGLLTATFHPDEFQRGEPWKFGYSIPLATLAVIAASVTISGRRPGDARSVGYPIAMGVANLLLNFRSHYAILVGAGAISGLTRLASRIAPRRKLLTPGLLLGLILCALVLGWASLFTYSQLAGGGLLGERARQKYEQQSSGDLGVFLGGRSESLVSLRAIADSPILGHGSWAADRYYVMLRIQMLRDHGVATQADPFGLIPTHSYIFGAWVEAGILGALFWATVIGYLLVGIGRTVDLRPPAAPFMGYLLSFLLWNIPFSPFGGHERFPVAGQLCAAIWVLSEYRKKYPSSASAPSRGLARSLRQPATARSVRHDA